ncbi:MAG: DNA methyltransferase, partial [Bacteroidetes bacterium]|nr:DNA methyltransferase [Bacteroidota bacterium]
AYSVKLVSEIIKKDCYKNSQILDPFSGTATTGLVAAELGFNAMLFDINPFLIWLGNTKCKHFSVDKLLFLQKEFNNCIDDITLSENLWTPPIHNIERWWHPATLEILASIRSKLALTFNEPNGNYYHNLVWIAFSRLIIETSAADFNHVSMSFKKKSLQFEFSQIKQLFEAIFNHIISSAKTKLAGKAKVIKGDSRNLSAQGKEIIDTVITSPPYPNRISYIRELRPYMYWVKFLHNGNDASALDWETIGGTWGTATSNLKDWKAQNKKLPVRLYDVCNKINSSGDKNSGLMSNYVHKYFDDMYSHLQNLKGLLKPNAKLNYIVGNSSFYRHFVDTEIILAEIFLELGYKSTSIETIRRRNTKRGLLEFNVTASWKQ